MKRLLVSIIHIQVKALLFYNEYLTSESQHVIDFPSA